MKITSNKIDIMEVLKQCSNYLREYEEIMPLAEHEIETPFIIEDLIKTVDELIDDNKCEHNNIRLGRDPYHPSICEDCGEEL